MFDMRRTPVLSEAKRLRACFLLCMLCTLCTHIHLMVGMDTYEKIWLYTSNVQIVASLAFLVLAVRRPLSPTGRWHLALGLAVAVWVMVTKYMHALYGEPPEPIGLLLSRFLVLLPFAELCGDTDKCSAIKGAAVLTWIVCLWLGLMALLLVLNLVPQGLSEYVYWSGARINPLWNAIIFAVVMFMGIALCVAGCFLTRKRWLRIALIVGAAAQLALVFLTHSRTNILMICAFAAGTFLFTAGGGKLRRNLLLAVLGLCLAGGIYFGSEAIYKANNQRLIDQLRSQENVDLPTKQELDENYRDVDIWINEDGYLTDGVSNQGTLAEDMGTLNGRKDTWSAIVEAFRNSKDLRLFGTSRFRDRILPEMAHAHNSWLQMMVQLGIPGLVFSLALTAEILIACARVLLRCRDKAKITMTMWVLCMLPIGFMEPFLFNAGHVGDLFILVSGYLWAWGRKRD